jgi:uncharacterized membrane protein
VTRVVTGDPADGSGVRLERSIARLLTVGTWLSIALLAVGFVLMLAQGVSPLDPAPAFDLRSIPAHIAALDPLGFLWLGLIVVVATPSARVAAALLGYSRAGDRRMALVAVAVLVVIGLSVALASTVEV